MSTGAAVSSSSSSSSSSSASSSHAGVVRKPLQVLCFLCCREYGTQSLRIHWKACRRRLAHEVAQLPKARRYALCDPPDELRFPFPVFGYGREGADVFLNYNAEALRLFRSMFGGVNAQPISCVRACLCVCVRARARACVCTCVCERQESSQ